MLSRACASANSGSCSTAFLNNGSDAASPCWRLVAIPRLYDFSASSDPVVASRTGASYFPIDASDSPSPRRSCSAALPSALSTVSLLSACTCCFSIMSPVRQFEASSEMT